MKTCKICKTTIVGRSDKVFCSTPCKNEYHVKLRRATNLAAIKVDNILHRNRSILLELMGKNSTQKQIHKDLLDKKGFNYTHITGYHINSKGKMVHQIYDFSYLIFSDQGVRIYRRK